MIRKATPADIPKAIEIALEALAIDPYPELVVSQERVRAAVTECISSAAHFAWVSEIEGEVVGGIGALVTPMIFHERSQASILLWYCRTPGDGAALMRERIGRQQLHSASKKRVGHRPTCRSNAAWIYTPPVYFGIYA